MAFGLQSGYVLGEPAAGAAMTGANAGVNMTTTTYAVPWTLAGTTGFAQFKPRAAATQTAETSTIQTTGWVDATDGAFPGGALSTKIDSIVAGQWTVAGNIVFSVAPASLVFQVGVRFWQANAAATSGTLIPIPGANANGWTYTANLTPGVSTTQAFNISVAGVSAVTLSASTPYLWLEIAVNVITKATLTSTMNPSVVSLTTPALSYTSTGTETTSASEAATRQFAGFRQVEDFCGTEFHSTDEQGFETSTAGYTSGTGTLSRDTAQARSGAAALKFISTVTGSMSVLGLHKTSAVAGRSYLVDMWVRPSIALTLVADVIFYTSADAFNGQVFGAGISCPANQWTRITQVGVAPANTGRVQLAYFNGGATPVAVGTTIWLDDAHLDEMADIDSSNRVAAYNRSIADTTSASDSATRKFVGSRPIAESTTTSDSSTRTLILTRPVSEAVAIGAEAASRVLTTFRQGADTTAVGETATRQVKTFRQTTDTSTALDACTRMVVLTRLQSEALTTADSATRRLNLHRDQAESLTAGGGITNIFIRRWFDD